MFFLGPRIPLRTALQLSKITNFFQDDGTNQVHQSSSQSRHRHVTIQGAPFLDDEREAGPQQSPYKEGLVFLTRICNPHKNNSKSALKMRGRKKSLFSSRNVAFVLRVQRYGILFILSHSTHSEFLTLQILIVVRRCNLMAKTAVYIFNYPTA